MEDRRDLDPAPPAHSPAAAAAAPPETELGGPGTPRDPAQRDTEGTPPRAAAAGHPGTTVRVCDLSRLIVWVMLALPGVVPGSGAIGRVPGGVVARCSRCSGRFRARMPRAACALRARSRGSGRCRGVVLAGAGGELSGVAPVFGLVSGTGAGLGGGGRARTGSGPGYRGAGWPGGRDGEQRERAHGQHGVPVEGGPEAELVLVQAGLPLSLLEASPGVTARGGV